VGKIGATGNAELAVAAIVDGNPPDVVLNREIVEAYDLDDVTLGPWRTANGRNWIGAGASIARVDRRCRSPAGQRSSSTTVSPRERR
jgi:predicted phosphoribosyltransferase